MSYHRAVQQRQIQQNQASQYPTGVALSALNKKRIKDTDKFQIDEKTKKNHRDRLNEMMEFIKIKYPTYSRECIREITQEDREDERHNWDGAKYDFACENLHSDVIKAFMAIKKVKKFKLPKTKKARAKAQLKNPEMKDKLCSFEHIRKQSNR